ncbi:FHA domain-containing protein [Mycolicibacterium boenickei]|uniref:FHA domain-containing protein n=1 Tax=Mycolicibacterium boenickei TaxID=146017 RepID=A0AAX3A0A1_9MYCO|nr:BTAD domain-containing putative transcriptional regulator [Mycolicibacterium boenickei]PEG57643.1 regulator [Mycolicibacterium boenickei]UNC01116.1 FHA domain-containing protein [Mycolicibacterium boenickei]BBX90963.1 transcriptional regulatory protein EmbR [Mycolicibacterium boenickei]
MSGTRLGFGLLGPLQVTVDGTPVGLGTPKQRAVLAFLLINRNRAVSTESLIDAVWDREPVPAARATIHTHVSNLRRLLGASERDSQPVLVNAAPGYRLNVTEGSCDLDRFATEKAAGINAAAAGRFEAAGTHLSAALTHWRGDVLEDLRGFTFADAFAAALTEDYVLVHTSRAEAEIACGRAATVIAGLEELAARHPYREPLWAQLITAYYVAERQSDALAAYRRVKTVLAEELGIDPGPTLSALYQRILRQERLDTKQAAMATAARTVSAGGTVVGRATTAAALRDTAGRRYALRPNVTRIGRLPDNDIVLDDADVSRHHAVIIDTGSSFVITDLQSANGVQVRQERIHPSATVGDGDDIRICGRQFTFELLRGAP